MGAPTVSGEEIDTTYIVEWADRLGLRAIWDVIVRRLDDQA